MGWRRNEFLRCRAYGYVSFGHHRLVVCRLCPAGTRGGTPYSEGIHSVAACVGPFVGSIQTGFREVYSTRRLPWTHSDSLSCQFGAVTVHRVSCPILRPTPTAPVRPNARWIAI